MFNKPYDAKALKRLNERARLISNDESLTQQQFVDDCDINIMIRRFTENPHLMPDRQQGMYFDHTEFTDLATSQNRQIQLDDEFNALPSQVRAKFENNSTFYAEHLVAQSELKTEHEKKLFYQKLLNPQPEALPTPPLNNSVTTPPATQKPAATATMINQTKDKAN